MKKNPLISFCIATYKREKFLPQTIQSILNQKYSNIEIIVSDNDTKGSAKKIVAQFKSKKIIYHKNKKNIGMVKNFNKAFSLSHGDFIVFLSDDDPIEENMLDILIPLYRKYPEYDGYFGASNIYIPDQIISDLTGFPIGKTSLLSSTQNPGEVRLYSQNNFLEKFITYQITSYILWSGGFAKRSLVKKIGGMPDYNARYLTDFAYIAHLGAEGKLLYVNTPVGYQTFHTENSGRDMKSLQTMPVAVIGFYTLIHPYITPKLENAYQNYLMNWVIDHFMGAYEFHKKQHLYFNKKQLLQIYSEIGKKLPFFKKRYLELCLKITFPFFFTIWFSYTGKIKRKIVRIFP